MALNLAVYRKFLTTNEGRRVLFRPLLEEDHKRLFDMFQTVPDGDIRFLKDDVRDPVLIERWISNLNYERVLPLVALFEDRLVGDCTLHFGRKAARHMAEVRIFLAPDFRGVGLGSKMLQEAEDVARKMGLKMLTAEVILDHIGVVKAFRRLGFELRSTGEDYYMAMDGSTHDIAFLVKRLTRQEYTF